MAANDSYNAVLAYNEAGVKEHVENELASGVPVAEILSDGLIAAMDEIGKKFSEGEIYVPEMLMAAQVMKSGLEILKPHLASSQTESKGTIVIGTVKGDLHDIGKNLVAMLLEGGGFTVVDLGVDVDSSKFIASAEEHGASVVALSALLTTTLPAMRDTVKVLKDAGVQNILVGGAPVTQEFADEIGAAGYSQDAPGAVILAREF